MSNITTFSFQSQEVRTVILENSLWFVAKDVCEVLELSNPSVAVDSLDSDERAKFNLGRSSIHGGGGDINIISESGLYALIFKSRKPEAKKFRKWITSEVLPTLRRTDSYSVQPSKGRGTQWMNVRVNPLKKKFFGFFCIKRYSTY